MAIKNKDGSTYRFTQSPPTMSEQVFWNKKEKVTVHNKFGQRYLREQKGNESIDFSKIKSVIEEPEDDIKIVETIEESKSKPLSEEVVEVWCLPCVSYSENFDPLYDESYGVPTYGDKFIFRARLLSLEDLSINFIAEAKVNIPNESVIFPKTASRRWWRVKDHKEVKDFKVYIGMISDYQPNFEG